MATYQEIVDTLKAALDDPEHRELWHTYDYHKLDSVVNSLMINELLDRSNGSLKLAYLLSIPELEALAQQDQSKKERINGDSPMRIIHLRIIAHFFEVGNAYLAQRESEAGE